MSVRLKSWVCRRVSDGKPCLMMNGSTARKCAKCGKPRPARRRPAHMVALDTPYEEWVERFGERCGICGKGPKPNRRLDRDHAHSKAGGARGLLCPICNMRLKTWMTAAWLRSAADYLERHDGATMAGVPVPDVEGRPSR